MPKVTDLKAYYREVAAKAGLDEATITQVTGALDNAAFAKAFGENFKPLPDYSHDLDDVRTKTKADKDAEYSAWYTKEMAKYNEWVKNLDSLKLYEEKYGPLDGSNPNPNPDGNGKSMLTKEEVQQLLDARLNDTLGRRDATVLALLEVREQHMDDFKSRLDTKAFETAWKSHPEWGGDLKLAYSQFVAPEVEKIREAKAKTDADRRYEEGVRDGFSRRAVPTDHQSKTFSPMFDRKEDVAKLDDAAQERHSREAFFEGLREQKTT